VKKKNKWVRLGLLAAGLTTTAFAGSRILENSMLRDAFVQVVQNNPDMCSSVDQKDPCIQDVRVGGMTRTLSWRRGTTHEIRAPEAYASCWKGEFGVAARGAPLVGNPLTVTLHADDVHFPGGFRYTRDMILHDNECVTQNPKSRAIAGYSQ
jgi:hypothetical protein